ncbi:thiamine pyrophosphate-binding protein [Haloferula chungangensis]|uniref:Thiamine pyrophosphate-binding protein n=1 Tax=Haloferula chungangensis TaxID=1048331 RepID=A0ABW2L8E6_9BACT
MSSWEKAVEVVGECLEQGIREFVVCAGARNAALVAVLVQAESAGHVTLRRHFEERSAGFFALGRTMSNGEPCAVVTTSGTAVAELLPAVIEARYQGRPLVAITADRPAAYRGSGAPQAINQIGIFGEHAGSGDLGGWDRRSPWHLNVELEEAFEAGEWQGPGHVAMSHQIVWPRLAVSGLARWLKEDLYRGLVLMIGGLDPDEREEVFHFALDLEVPVVAEGTSGLREALAALALPDPDRTLKAKPPGKILRLGAVPSGRFWRDLEDLPKVDVWNVCRSGYSGLARGSQTITGDVGRVVKALGEIESADDALDYLPGCSRRYAEIDELLEAYPDSEPAMVRTISHYAALGSGVFVGNSLPIREWNLFAQRDRPIPEVSANRGVNGIDGQISTWLGASAAKEDSWCVLGDLTAMYDLAAPAMLGQVVTKGRVLVVINNGGGQIFSRVPRLQSMGQRGSELMQNPHSVSLEGWAAMWGMDYLSIRTADDFDALEAAEKMLLVELVPSPSETVAFWKRWDRL